MEPHHPCGFGKSSNTRFVFFLFPPPRMTPVSLLLIGLATKEMEIRDQERRALEEKARVKAEERQSLEAKPG